MIVNYFASQSNILFAKHERVDMYGNLSSYSKYRTGQPFQPSNYLTNSVHAAKDESKTDNAAAQLPSCIVASCDAAIQPSRMTVGCFFSELNSVARAVITPFKMADIYGPPMREALLMP
jgi:hypothetical protein